jgi:hypothetical protein
VAAAVNWGQVAWTGHGIGSIGHLPAMTLP